MYDEKVLELMQPKMSIEYRIEAGMLTGGTFDNIPENAFGAHIGASFPVVGANGEFRLGGTSYDLFVGEVFEVNGLLEKVNKPVEGNDAIIVANEISKEKIQEYQSKGITKVVSTKIGVVPLKYGDAAFSTQEEMAAAITKINQTFKSVNISVQNAEMPRMHR